MPDPRVEGAFSAFDNNERPEGFRPSRSWYVQNSEGKLYPAKAIWAMVLGCRAAEFNTKDARNELANLGYSLIDVSSLTGNDPFEAEINRSLADTDINRRARLAAAPSLPQLTYVINRSYARNPDVVAEVLEQANGIYGECQGDAPFNKRSNGRPYLEVHHRTQLSCGGEDTVENAVALCPNCHRKIHFG